MEWKDAQKPYLQKLGINEIAYSKSLNPWEGSDTILLFPFDLVETRNLQNVEA